MNGTPDYKMGERMGIFETSQNDIRRDIDEWKKANEKAHADICYSLAKMQDKLDLMRDDMAKLREEFAGYKVKMGTITAVIAAVASIGTAVASSLIINGIMK